MGTVAQEYLTELEDSLSWDRKDTDDPGWYEKIFTPGLIAGPKPSIRKLYLQHCELIGETPQPGAPKSWYEAVEKYNYRQRWDDFYQAEGKRRISEYRERQQQAQQRNLSILDKLLSKLEAEIAGAEGSKLQQLTYAVNATIEQARKEFGYDVQRIMTIDEDAAIRVTIPGVSEDAL